MVKKLKDITCYECSKICDENTCDCCPLKMCVTEDGKVVDEERDDASILCIHDDLDDLFNNYGLANYEIDISEEYMYHDDSSKVKTETTTEVKYNSEGGITW